MPGKKIFNAEGSQGEEIGFSNSDETPVTSRMGTTQIFHLQHCHFMCPLDKSNIDGFYGQPYKQPIKPLKVSEITLSNIL